MFDSGNGSPDIVRPGVQGRWEWMMPAIRELQKRCRTVTYTLCGDFGSGLTFDPELGFENYTRQLDAVFERTGLERAALCGVSYGGFIALRYAALRPERVSALIFSSAPSPGWTPSARQRGYVSRPWRSAPAFVLGAPMRLWPEIHAAHDTWPQRLVFLVQHGLRVLAAPMKPGLMASRVRMQQRLDFFPDCARITVPTLVLSGEDELDRVVPTEVTRQYEALIPGAQYARLERSGHIGLITRPAQYAEIVAAFVARAAAQPANAERAFSPALEAGSRGRRTNADTTRPSMDPEAEECQPSRI
jgi:pimeloyl-ACP methyl ester carboxylesterase